MTGPTAELLAWLVGRSDGAAPERLDPPGLLPDLPALVVINQTSQQDRGDEESMSYTGNVSVGGPADTRELPGLTITKVAVGPMDNNAYLLRCTQHR